jgi:hypothetical protein
MFGKILAFIAAVIGIICVIAVFQPDDFRIERSIAIAAPASAVFAQVNDFHKWQAWSPWEKMDPAMKRTFEGPAAGAGAMYSWVGNSKVGEGKMTLTASKASENIHIQLDFLKPMKATNQTEFIFKTEGKQTLVTWSMTGTKNFISKIFCLFMNMDKMVGGDFEKGLSALKESVESSKK